ncbi:ATP-grasp domain-containing protein [Gracilibacillus timonensis]|uniref:ATP-grasp domain-containing protein n=1 Tax=Gracilibacillus timonensis TaxID=1816696 RepID=UPI000825BA26|nr:ATP-grasp domain-containing protein [Gracilibacillus timonensis]
MKTLLYVNIRNYKVERLKPIYTAKKMGYRIALLADVDPGLDEGLIDDLILVNTYDMKASVKASVIYAKKHAVAGVLTWSEKDVELVAKIGAELGLPTISTEAAKRARNKYFMRDALREVEGICPKFKRVLSLDDWKQAVDEIGTPGIFKPVGAAGSKGIFKIEADTDIHEAYEVMINSTSPDDDKIYTYYPNEYIYEEYLDGAEVSVDGVVQDHNVYITGVADNLVSEEYSLDYMEIFPSEKDEATVNEIKKSAETVVKTLGFNHCSFHLEGRVTTDGFKLIEVAARPAGGFIASHVMENASGISYLEFIIKVAVGESIKDSWPDFDTISTHSVCHYEVLADQEGVVTDIRGLDDVMEDEDVILIIPVRQINEEVVLPPEDFESSYLATAIIRGKGYEEVKKKIDRLESKLEYKINEQ